MKRAVFKLLVFLVLGAVFTVAVAWACAARTQYRSTVAKAQLMDPSAKELSELRAIAARLTKDPSLDSGLCLRSQAIGTRTDGLISREVSTSKPPVRGSVFGQLTAGFPFASLQGWSYEKDRGSVRERFSMIGITTSWAKNDRLGLPIAPLWPGFAIDAIVYATASWLAYSAPIFLRRRRRLHTGRCVHCGYLISASPVCTECGSPVKPKPAETAA